MKERFEGVEVHSLINGEIIKDPINSIPEGPVFQPRKVDLLSKIKNSLPYMVQGYISMELVKRHPDIAEDVKKRLSQAQLDTYEKMSDDDKLQLHNFGQIYTRLAQEEGTE